MLDGAELPMLELSSLSRSVSQCGSLPTSKYARCITCKKSLLGGPAGSIECKRCNAKTKEDLSIHAGLAQLEADKLQSERRQAKRLAKPLFRRSFRGKIRKEKIVTAPGILHGHSTETISLELGRLSNLGQNVEAGLPSRKRKHGKA